MRELVPRDLGSTPENRTECLKNINTYTPNNQSRLSRDPEDRVLDISRCPAKHAHISTKSYMCEVNNCFQSLSGIPTRRTHPQVVLYSASGARCVQLATSRQHVRSRGSFPLGHGLGKAEETKPPMRVETAWPHAASFPSDSFDIVGSREYNSLESVVKVALAEILYS